MAVIVQNHGRPCGTCRDMKMSDAAVACAYIKIIWAPINGAQAVLVCVFECERCHSNNHNTRNTEAITVLRMVTSHPGGPKRIFARCMLPSQNFCEIWRSAKLLVGYTRRSRQLAPELIFCVTPILPPQIQRHSQNTIPLIQSLFSKLFRWESLFDVVVGRHEERNV